MIRYHPDPASASPDEQNDGKSAPLLGISEFLKRSIPLALCGALLLALLLSYISMMLSGNASAKRTDFVAPYTAASLVIHGHGGSIYDLRVTGHFQRALVFPLHIRDSALPFLYAPYFALVVAPLGTLPYLAAYLGWLAVNCLLFGMVLLGLARYIPLKGQNLLLWWVASVAFLGSFVALIQGQMSMVLLAAIGFCFLFSWRAAGMKPSTSNGTLRNQPPMTTNEPGPLGGLLHGRFEELAGVALAFATIKAPYLLPFLLVFAIRRRWRTLLGFALTALVLFAIPTVVFGVPVEAGYFQSLLHAAQSGSHIGGYEPKFNHDFAGFTQLLLPARLAAFVTVALDLVALLLLAKTAARARDIDIPFGLATVVCVLIAPHALIHDLVLLLIPAAVTLRHAHLIPRAGTVLTMGYAGIVVGLPLVSFVPLQLSVMMMCALSLLLFRAAIPRQTPLLGRDSAPLHGAAMALRPVPGKTSS